MSRSKAATMNPEPSNDIESQHDVDKSDSDEMFYRGLTLKNGIRVLLVSDPTTDKSAASLLVQVGYLTEPRSIPGLAHFCEHMLFMGTKKYPVENHFSAFLSNNGGSSNAYTFTDVTCYYFDVMPEKFKEASDIFAQFFLEPLFAESSTDRELLAVDNEHRKNIKNDAWRLWRLEGVTGDPEHDFSKFGTGSKETLQDIPKEKNIDIRKALLDFHSEYYSSNIMEVCLLGKESLDELSDLAVELFGKVPNKNIKAPEWLVHPFGDAQLRKVIRMVPVEDSRQMVIMFPVPDVRKQYKAGASSYVNHLVCHEGEGSVLSYLKKQGWVSSMNGEVEEGARGFSFFAITLELSIEGLEHSNEIAAALFQYLKMLRQHGPQEWVFDEIRKTLRNDFRFKPKEDPVDYVVNVTKSMQFAEWKDTLSAMQVVENYEPELIQQFLSNLVPEKIWITLVSKTFKGKTDLQEKYYSTEYSIEDIPQEKIDAWKNIEINDAFHLPPVNEFIPTNFDLAKEEPGYTTKPSLLLDQPGNRLWFMQDKEYKLPRSIVQFELRNPIRHETALNVCLLDMAVNCFGDAYNEYFYPAALAGLKYEVATTVAGLGIKVIGFNERQQALLEKICEKLIDLKIDPKRFDVLKEAHIRLLKNQRAAQPYEHANYYLGIVLSEKACTYEEQLAAMENCTLEKCRSFLSEFLKRASLEGLVYGNLRSEEALKMSHAVRQILKFDELTFAQTENFREHKLGDGKIYEYTACNEVHPNNAIMTYYQVGSLDTANIRTIALNDLLCQILDEPCFDVLRTREQLGYIVCGRARRSQGTFGTYVLVQSDKSSSFLAERIENFINNHLKGSLTKLSAEELKEHKTALISLKLEKPKNLSEKFSILWNEISERTYIYDRNQREADEIAKLTKEDITDFFNKHIAHEAPALKELMVKVNSKSDPGEPAEGIKADFTINDLNSFRSAHACMERPAQPTKV